jgi:carboxymethylenebutenolidase
VACNLDVDAAVDCYGGRVVVGGPDELTERQPQAPIDMTPNLHCPLLGLFGVDDANPSPAHVDRMKEELEANGKTYEFHSYENTGHAFFSTDRPAYRVEAANDGWQRIFAWYGKYLAD